MPGWTPSIPVRHPYHVHLPRALEALYPLVGNLWWTWTPEARRLFSAIHSRAWSRYQNPVEVLHSVEPSGWEALAEDQTFLASLSAVSRSLRAYLDSAPEAWFARRFPDYDRGPFAYFSTEFGLHESLPIYSGGLGVLSGDHLKSASDLGVPLVAVGLLYRTGYFRQTIDFEGLQQHSYQEIDFARLGVSAVVAPSGRDLTVSIPFPGRDVVAKVWMAQVGRVPLLLLDTDTLPNDPADRPITQVLYVRGREMRLAQELVLGVGGVRALQALGIGPAVWHLNEGHSALLQLERLRAPLTDGSSLSSAIDVVRRNSVFTTHTPVPAGHETFDPELAAGVLAPWEGLLEASRDPLLGKGGGRLLALGEAGRSNTPGPFNLTAFALRTSGYANGVSEMNARVAQDAWQTLLDKDEGGPAVIRPITNGVHVPSWIGPEIRDLFLERWGSEWAEALGRPAAPHELAEIPDSRLWAAHREQKQRLAVFLRGRLRTQFARHGRSPEELRAVEKLLDPEILTVGFARRFATYKRAALLFTDRERLARLLTHSERPMQVILAGKAHPADRPGQELIQRLFRLSQEPDLVGRVFFVEGYDLGVAAPLVQGVDVWLNTPRRPLEASGTSGMKAAINGVLNCSILDGWWPEAFDASNGWTIEGGDHGSEERQDAADAEALYRVLEDEIVPAFYDRDGGLPQRWLAMMKQSIASVAAGFSSDRMVRDYVEQAYLPRAMEVAGARPLVGVGTDG